MLLSSLLSESGRVPLPEHWKKFFQDRAERINAHVLTRLSSPEKYGRDTYYWLDIEFTFMSDEILSFDEQAEMVYRIFLKEFKKLAGEERQEYLPILGGHVSFTDPDRVKDTMTNTKHCVETAENYLSRFTSFGAKPGSKRGGGEYQLSIMMPEHEVKVKE